MSKANIQHALYVETEAAKALRDNLASLFEGDNQLALDSIEGETNLLETIERAIQAIGEDKAAITGLEEYMRDLQARRDRLKQRVEMVRTALLYALKQAGRNRIETPYGTASITQSPVKVSIVEESEIPVDFFRPGEPKLDKKALKKALEDGQSISGAELSADGETITLRFK